MGSATINDVHFLAADLYSGLLVSTGVGCLGATLPASGTGTGRARFGLDCAEAMAAGLVVAGVVFASAAFLDVATVVVVEAARVLFFGVVAAASAAKSSEAAALAFFLGALVDVVAGVLVLRDFFVVAGASSPVVMAFFVARGFAAVDACRGHCGNALGLAELTRRLELLPSNCVFMPNIFQPRMKSIGPIFCRTTRSVRMKHSMSPLFLVSRQRQPGSS